jgi:hypothetical protein
VKGKFATIARYQYSSEAQIIKGRLESEGIQVFLSDHITIDTDPLVSNAIGGVKLKVLSEDALKAQHIINSLNLYSVDEEGQPIICPNCKANKVNLFSSIDDFKSLLSYLIGFLFGTLPFSTRYHYKCEDCNFEFPVK